MNEVYEYTLKRIAQDSVIYKGIWAAAFAQLALDGVDTRYVGTLIFNNNIPKEYTVRDEMIPLEKGE